MKVKMSNSNFIELSCELAHNRVPKSEIIENLMTIKLSIMK